MTSEGPSGSGSRRPGSTKAPAANALGFVALGPKKTFQPRPANAPPSAREIFGAVEPRPIGVPSSASSVGGYRRPVPLGTGSTLTAPQSSASGARTQLPKPVPVFKDRPDAAAPSRPGPPHSFPRATPSVVKVDPSRKVDIKEWQRIAVDTDGKNLSSVVKMVASGDSSMGEHQIIPMICGAVKQLVQNRHKEIDDVLVMALSRLAALKAEYFRSENVRTALMALVKKEQFGTAVGLKGKISAVNCMIGANLLYAVYQNVPRWPVDILKLYLEDAAMDRQWVDLMECREFVRAIRCTFGTRCANLAHSAPTSGEPLVGDTDSLRRPDDAEMFARLSTSPNVTLSAGVPSPLTLVGEDSLSDSNFSSATSSMKDIRIARIDRFEQFQNEIPEIIMEVIREATKRGNDGGKHLVRFLISTAGVTVARAFGMQRIDTWLQNAKTANAAMTLMATICANCTGTTEDDLSIISTFLKIRLKSKSQTEIYFACLNELLERNVSNLQTVLRMTFEAAMNDIVMGKPNPWTATVMSAAFKSKPVESSSILANLYADCIVTNMDDCSRSLKLILHDLAKLQKADIRLEKFVTSFLAGRAFLTQTDTKRLRSEEQGTRDKKLLTVIDIVLAAEVLMMITRFKEEMFSGNPDAFINALVPLQETTISFLRKHGAALFSVSPDALRATFRKIFYLDKPTLFQIMDKWPTEHERAMFFKVAGRIPVTSTVLWQLRVQMSGCDTMMLVEMLELLLVRALGQRADEYDVLKLGDLKFDFVDTILDLGVFRPTENVTFPPKYRPPNLVRREIYWQCWKIVVLLAAAEPSLFGAFAWNYLPTARVFIQMLIINRFTFPPESMLTAEKDVRFFTEAEQKLVEEEKKAIVEFENRLAGGTTKNLLVNESNAKMPKDYMRFDPKGNFRCPPDSFLKVLETMGRALDLGKIFSGCRSPDFLLDILNEKGTAASLPWLLEITSSSKSMFDVLPVECVCEMLSNSLMKNPTGSSEKKDQDFQKCRNLAIRLSDSIRGEASDVANVLKTLDFFCDGLRAETAEEREIARTGLEIVFDPNRIESAIYALWGVDQLVNQASENLPDFRPDLLPKSKHGISIEHVLARTRPHAWCPDFIVQKAFKVVSYLEKFHWLLVDIPARSPHFSAIKDNLCLQLSKALDVESDVLTVCAYLEFLAVFLRSSRCPQPEIPVLYYVVQRVADVVVNRRDLRDALLLGRNSIISKEDVQRIRRVVVTFFDAFLFSSVEVAPTDFGEAISQLEEPLVKSNCKMDNLGRTACLTTTIARALPILTAIAQSADSSFVDDEAENLLSFCLDRTAFIGAKEWLSGKSVAILTTGVRECILRLSQEDRLVDMALHDISVDFLLELICCENIPMSNIHKMIGRLDLDDANVVAKLKYAVNKHTLVARTLLEDRLATGLALEEPVHRMIKTSLDGLTNVFSLPFTTW